MKILLASHGTFAEGIKNALEVILGKQINIKTLCAYVNGETDVKGKIHKFLSQIKPGENWIVVTDIFGGSVNNEFMVCLKEYNFALLSGMNLPMLVELVSNDSQDVEEKIKSAIEVAKGEVKYCNLLLSESAKQAEDDF